MPIPKPRKGEEKDKFISRCMADPVMVREYDQKQRYAICLASYQKGVKNMGVLQNLAINVKTSGLVRHDRMEGREYLVVPMVMIVEGVLNGSRGALYYPAEELEKFPESWNYKPVVVYHPEINGVGVSACNPEILTKQKIGVIMNARFEKGKLKAEAWLEPERIKEVDSRIMEAIEREEMLELSTGLFVDVEPMDGVFNGKDYVGIARNYRPDHLAILPDKVGACSIEDGAGFLRNAKWSTKYINDLPDSAFLYIESGGKKDEEGKTTPRSLRHLPYKDADGNIDLPHLRNAVARIPQMKISAALKKRLQAKARALLDKYKKSGLSRQSLEKLEGVFNGLKGLVDDNIINELRDVISDVVIYERKVVMDKEKLIKELIESGLWNEDDREVLEAQEDGVLNRLKEVTEKAIAEKNELNKKVEELLKNSEKADESKEEKPSEDENQTVSNEEINKEDEPMTVDEYIAQAPDDIQEVLKIGLATHQRMRDELIKAILANKNNVLTEEQLKEKSFEDLRAMAALAANEKKKDETKSVFNYIGQAPVEEQTAEEPLELPTINWGEK